LPRGLRNTALFPGGLKIIDDKPSLLDSFLIAQHGEPEPDPIPPPPKRKQRQWRSKPLKVRPGFVLKTEVSRFRLENIVYEKREDGRKHAMLKWLSVCAIPPCRTMFSQITPNPPNEFAMVVLCKKCRQGGIPHIEADFYEWQWYNTQ
jgi:hypothetical protein